MFESPDTLRKYALAVASQLRTEGFIKQSEILEQRANLACTTGWEWLGELGLCIEQITALGALSNDVEEKLNKILKATNSSKPYG